MRTRVTLPVAVAAVAALAAPVVGQAPASAAHPARVGVANAQPSAVRGATPVANARPSQKLSIKLFLADRHASELAGELRAVSDPTSARYGKYLTPKQFRARYAPSAASLTAVKSFLRENKLAFTGTPANHLYVAAAGTVANVERAFTTSLKEYRVHGTSLRAAATSTTIPANLAGTVIAVSGLASRAQLMTPDHVVKQAPPPDAFVNAPPCSSFFGEKIATSAPAAYGHKQPYAPCGYVPHQLQGTYGLTRSISQGFDGRGVTVAITDAYAAPTILEDANTYATRHGEPAFRKGQFTQVAPSGPYRFGFNDKKNGDLCGEQGWYGEETLDVEAVHSTAPGAHVTYVPARSCDNGDFAVAINRVVDRHLADIVTNSWGGTDESNGSPELDRAYQQVFYQAGLQGIGFYFSSGDSGDGASDNNGTPTVQSPANSNLVTAVGGTSLAVNAGRSRMFETGWSTGRSALDNGSWSPTPPGDFQYGAGGGTSRKFAQPWYQRGVVPSSLSRFRGGQPKRVVPDISTVGDPNTGMRVGETQTFPNGSTRYSEYRIGGTSLSSPLMAGIMAIADQVYGRPHGFANPAFYALYGSKALYDPQHKSGTALVRVDYVNGVNASDGTSTSLRTLDSRSGTILRTTSGYDDTTGVGTPKGEAFLGSVGYAK